MTRDFLKPQKTTGLDTNTPAGKRSPFASRPFARIPRPEMSPQDIQTMRERAARVEQLGHPMMKAWANTQPTVQQQAMPEEENEENLQTQQESTVQRQELEEEETLQTKAEPTLQPEELPEEEDKTLQMQSEPDVQLKCQNCKQEQAEVQTKLTIGQPGDKYEQEADNMASQVMSMAAPTAQNVQRQETEEEETLQQKPLTDSITPVVQRQTRETQPQDNASQNLESQLATAKGGGSPLSDEVRGFMEPRFGADFSEVRVHTGTAAVQMNQQLGAQAFTHGNDIYYGQGKAPGNDALTAHELTHTIQQTPTTQVQRTYGKHLTTPYFIEHQSTVNQFMIQRQEGEDAKLEEQKPFVEGIETLGKELLKYPKFKAWYKPKLGLLKKRLEIEQPSDEKTALLAFGVLNVALAGLTFWLNPELRELLSDKDIGKPLGQIPYSPIEGFKYKLPEPGESDYGFSGKFTLNPYLKSIRKRKPKMPLTGASYGLDTAYNSKQGLSLTGGNLTLEFLDGGLKAEGKTLTELSQYPAIFPGNNPFDSTSTIMQSTPPDFRPIKTKPGFQFMLTVDFVKLASKFPKLRKVFSGQ